MAYLERKLAGSMQQQQEKLAAAAAAPAELSDVLWLQERLTRASYGLTRCVRTAYSLFLLDLDSSLSIFTRKLLSLLGKKEA